MNPEHINWSPVPYKRSIQVKAPKPGQTLRVIAAGPIVGVLTHWDGTKSVPCTCQVQAPPRLCEVQAPIWRGYLPAVESNGRQVIVEITLGAVNHCPQLLQETIFGWWVRISRPGAKANSAVFAEVLEDMRRCPNVATFDPRPRLLEMWGFKSELRNGSAPHLDPSDAARGGPDL